MDTVHDLRDSMLGGPLGRLAIHLREHPETVPEETREVLETYVEIESLLMMKAAFILADAGVRLEPALLADAEAVRHHQAAMVEQMLVRYARS